MNHQRVVLGLFVVAALIVGTAGYDTIRADRSVDVAVADDDEAYLAIERTGDAIPNGETGPILSITNHLGTAVGLDVVSRDVPDGVSDLVLSRDRLGTETETTLRARCAAAGEHSVDVRIEAEGHAVSVKVEERDVTVDCARSTDTATPTQTSTGS